MSEKPTPLFLIVLAGIGTGLLSPLNVNGTPILVLVIPFTILAIVLYNAETAIQVGIGASILSGLFVHALGLWDTVAYALASTTTILAYDAIYPKQKNELNAALFAVLGVLLYEFFSELYTKENILFRPELFLGTNPVLGVQIVASVLVMGVLFYQWVHPGKK
jgi:hypothetical protein